VEITKDLIQKIYKPENKEKYIGMKNILDIPSNFEQIVDLGLLPCPYHRYYYITDDILKDQNNCPNVTELIIVMLPVRCSAPFKMINE
jgi:alpha-galactosidase/6-phospho-beta-glucosidase family protein